MKNNILILAITLSLLLTLMSPVMAASGDEAVDQALSWLATQQNADGGFSDGFSPGSGVAATADAIIAFAAGGQDVGIIRSADSVSPLDYLFEQVATGQVDGVGILAKVVLAFVAAGVDPSSVAGQDLVGQIEAAYDAASGSYGSSIFDQALVVLALANASQAIPEGAVEYLLAYQTRDGAWNFMGETAENSGDTNTTALVLQALVAAGSGDDAQPTLDYFRRIQNDDGGWPYQVPSDFGTETDANSTALVLQALYAVGEMVDAWQVAESDPLAALLALQNASGSFSYQASFPGDNALATIQAVPTVAGATLARIVTVKTTTLPGAVTSTPPTTIPEAGGAGFQSLDAVVMMTAGLLLIAGGRRLKQAR